MSVGSRAMINRAVRGDVRVTEVLYKIGFNIHYHFFDYYTASYKRRMFFVSLMTGSSRAHMPSRLSKAATKHVFLLYGHCWVFHPERVP